MKRPALLALSALSAALFASPANAAGTGGTTAAGGDVEKTFSADICVYGGTSAAVTAAVQAARMGKSVIVVSPDEHLGGMTSEGLGFTDAGNTGAVGGLAREFYRRVFAAYERPEAWCWQRRADYARTGSGQGAKAVNEKERVMWCFEPHIAEGVFEAWLAEHRDKVRVIRGAGARLNRAAGGVKKRGARIESIATLGGAAVSAKVFLDATYEGDLLAAAGCSYRVGREPNAAFGERYNGNQIVLSRQRSHRFSRRVSPYNTAGDPSSGLLRGVCADVVAEDDFARVNGTGDRHVQAYCFRVCMTTVPENRAPFPKPDGYDPRDYELALRCIAAGDPNFFPTRGTGAAAGGFAKFDAIPNRKTDTNNHGPFSFDFLGGGSDEYPEASYERRAEIVAAHRRYQQGLLWFLCNDPRVPARLRERLSRWGLAKDEFADNAHWPRQLYIREARRLTGEYTITEHDILAPKKTTTPPRPVGLGSYTLDAHNTRRLVIIPAAGNPAGTAPYVQNEGNVQIHAPRPYHIDYAALTPRRAECENLLVPVCLSATHIAYGSIRMEPVFMLLGQSAATAAALAIDASGTGAANTADATGTTGTGNTTTGTAATGTGTAAAVQDVPYPVLRARLLTDGQRL
ncbi:MAG: FAD-dependent oxidoreductase [Puniceicoccales bacterium]|jgi:hypothetical protein|nr:FAD-dependent oxidoreductase [Puniceicoccales bacterium]